jgi:hypothetical protein
MLSIIESVEDPGQGIFGIALLTLGETFKSGSIVSLVGDI